MILEGFKLLLLGMGIVFFFLLVLLAVLRLFEKYLAEEEPTDPSPSATPATSTSEIIAVISAAVQLHRKNKIHGT